MPSLDWLTIRTSATAGLMIIIPAAILSSFLIDDDGPAALSILFVFLILTGFFVAGFGAGRMRDDTPMMHGSVAAIVCYVVVQTFGTVRRIAASESISLLSYPLFAMIAATCGIAGALFADWSARKTAGIRGEN